MSTPTLTTAALTEQYQLVAKLAAEENEAILSPMIELDVHVVTRSSVLPFIGYLAKQALEIAR